MLLSGKSLLNGSDVIRIVDNEAFDIGLLIGHEDLRLVQDESSDIHVTFPQQSIQEFLGSFYFILILNEGVSVEIFFRRVYRTIYDFLVGCACMEFYTL